MYNNIESSNVYSNLCSTATSELKSRVYYNALKLYVYIMVSLVRFNKPLSYILIWWNNGSIHIHYTVQECVLCYRKQIFACVCFNILPHLMNMSKSKLYYYFRRLSVCVHTYISISSLSYNFTFYFNNLHTLNITQESFFNKILLKR